MLCNNIKVWSGIKTMFSRKFCYHKTYIVDQKFHLSVPELAFLSVNWNYLTSFPSELLKGNNKLIYYQIPIQLKRNTFDLNDIACVRVLETEKKSLRLEIQVTDGQMTKFHHYPQEKVLGLTCSPDISWSVAQYRKSKSGTVIESDTVTTIQRYVEGLRNEFFSFKEYLKS